ncbi:MAG: TIGR02281 family clan AA aspartic protease [Pseudomonadales bacterium]|nr:TIGR02281 family clan AA aspartic protease [Pseudomonadales bacterium]
MLRQLFLLGFILICSTAAAAQQVSITVVGLFKNTAVVKINGQQAILKLNKPGPSGAVLLEADSKSALIQVAGKSQRYYLGRDIGTRYEKHVATQVVIKRNDIGQYITQGSINGLGVTFLVDTGATSIAMNERVARRLGIDYRVDGVEGQAMTAGGITRSWAVQLDSVKVGEIEVPNVRAAVIQGDTPHYVLLGMTYLNFVRFSERNQAIHLEPKF